MQPFPPRLPSSRSVCRDCGQPTAEFSSFCAGCRHLHRQHRAGKAGFWSKSITKSDRYTRQYNFSTRPAGSRGFFRDWWPLKLLLWPVWIIRKLLQLAR
jgi:hypothetical protein